MGQMTCLRCMPACRRGCCPCAQRREQASSACAPPCFRPRSLPLIFCSPPCTVYTCTPPYVHRAPNSQVAGACFARARTS